MKKLSLRELSEIIDEVREKGEKEIPSEEITVLSDVIELHRHGINFEGDGDRHISILKPAPSSIKAKPSQFSLN